jgi:hypothetical protein
VPQRHSNTQQEAEHARLVAEGDAEFERRVEELDHAAKRAGVTFEAALEAATNAENSGGFELNPAPAAELARATEHKRSRLPRAYLRRMADVGGDETESNG